MVLAGCPGRGRAAVACLGSAWSVRVPGNRAAAAPGLQQVKLPCLQFDLYRCSGPAALRPGKVKLGNCGQATMRCSRNMLIFRLGDPRMVREKESLQISSFFVMKPCKRFFFFFCSLHTLERGREGPPAQYEKVTFKKSNCLEEKANGTCLFAFV